MKIDLWNKILIPGNQGKLDLINIYKNVVCIKFVL